MNDRVLKRIGGDFGDSLSTAMTGCKHLSVTVASVKDGCAYVNVYEGENPFAVPTRFLNIDDAVLAVVPSVGSTASVAFLDGNENAPFFTSFSAVDEVQFTVGETCMIIRDGLVEFNGGGNGGAVFIKQLTDKLNDLVNSVNALTNVVNTHTHTGGSATGGAVTTIATTTQAQSAATFNFSDYLKSATNFQKI